MNTRARLLSVLLSGFLPAAALASIPSDATPSVIVSTAREPVAAGPFAPTWDSLRGYETPEWFRDAKFGIWAHWGPQCEPGMGDWYARHLYFEKGPAWGPNVTAFHRETYGHPSEAGFKDVIHRWKAENWNPDKLVALYKRAGAQYFFALANHHDNLDLWDSKYQPWNSVRVGPQKDLIAGWMVIDVDSEERAIELAGELSAAPGIGGRPIHEWLEVRPFLTAPPTVAD